MALRDDGYCADPHRPPGTERRGDAVSADGRAGKLVADLRERARAEHGRLYDLTGAPILEFRTRLRKDAVTAWLAVLALAMALPLLVGVALWQTLRLYFRLCLRPSSCGCRGRQECVSMTIVLWGILGGLVAVVV